MFGEFSRLHVAVDHFTQRRLAASTAGTAACGRRIKELANFMTTTRDRGLDSLLADLVAQTYQLRFCGRLTHWRDPVGPATAEPLWF